MFVRVAKVPSNPMTCEQLEKTARWISKRGNMTIRYNNGHTLEAVLLSRTATTMRIALQGTEDVLELQNINGAWITDECEPVNVDYAWSPRR